MRLPLWLPLCVLTVLLGSLIPFGSQGQDSYVLADTTIVHRIDKYVSVFIDYTDTLSIKAILLSDTQKKFISNKGNLTFGYLRYPIWLKVNVNTISLPVRWYLEIPAPFLEYVDFYQVADSKITYHSLSGYLRPQSVRDVPHTGHVYPLRFNSDLSSTLYIRIAGSSPKTFPLYIIEKTKFHDMVRLEDVGYGIFFGILIVMFFYNLFIFLILQHTNYFLYILTILCTFLIFASASGYAGKFLWPENPQMNFYAGRLTLGPLVIFLSIFTIRFLEVRQYSKIMYYALVTLMPLGALAFVLVYTGVLSSAGNNLISISTIIYMVSGVVCHAQGNRNAGYFIAAWTIYLIGGLLLTLRNSGVLDFNFFTTHFVEFGAAMETILIAFALGYRYRRYKKEKEAAQVQALKLQLSATERLEVKVNERTEQLSKTNEELQATLETNRRQTKIIENKNAELDAFFYRISHDLKGPISSLLGLSNIARKDLKDPQALVYIEKQNAQVERLNHIISGLIKLTKLNNSDLQKERIDFNKLIDDCIVACDGLPNFSNVKISKDIQDAIEFHTEWTLLNAILQNLIENAIKYARNDSPFVQINVRLDSDWLTIRVKDNGEGIPPDQQSKVFDMFHRATQNVNGTGLGLYILKRSVDKLQGTIEVESEVGVGSTFTVRLPVS